MLLWDNAFCESFATW